MDDDVAIPAEALEEFVEQVFRRAGVDERQSRLATEVLLWASLRGVDTHGIRNLKSMYIDPILAGKVNLTGRLAIEHETASTARADGQAALGLAVGCDAMQLAIDKAAATGVGIVNVRNSQHLGPAGYFAQLAIGRDQIGVAMTGEFFAGRRDIGVPPINSLQALFSTNPVSCAAPCGREAPFLLDMSTSATCINRVVQRKKADEAIPLGWAMDASGAMTSDAAAVQVMAPLGGTRELGGHKGVGLAMLVSILSAALSGAWSTAGPDGQRATGDYRQWSKAHFFAALRIDQFMPAEQFKQAMDEMVIAVRTAARIRPDEPVLYPGAPEHAAHERRSRAGVPLSPGDLDDLQALATAFKMAWPR